VADMPSGSSLEPYYANLIFNYSRNIESRRGGLKENHSLRMEAGEGLKTQNVYYVVINLTTPRKFSVPMSPSEQLLFYRVSVASRNIKVRQTNFHL
jgi:hypothetical protein